MSSLSDVIRYSLRSTEAVVVAVDVFIVPDASSGTSTDPEPSPGAYDRRFLAVVSHRDDWALTEEGAVFVYKTNSPSRSPVYGDLDVQSIYPIYGDFSIAMSQIRRSTLDLRAIDTKAVLEQPRSGFSLTINPAGGPSEGSGPPTFYANDVQSLGTLVSECKRLKEVSDTETPHTEDASQSSSRFDWLRPYFSKRIHLSILSPTPPDLRVFNKPLLQRLSPASAGLPGNDDADIELIRGEWIRNRARSLVRHGKRRLSLRLGTFNVNGKLPSQDLSSWIQGIRTSNIKTYDTTLPSIPPLKNASPLSLGNMMTNPLEWLRRRSDAQGTNSSVPSTYIPQPVDDDPDPDMFVLGFQELDLSAEALIYSTSTVREDAWCMAIFAALGEKAVRYEKLASKQLVGMLIVVIVKKALKPHFGDLKASSVGSGILGVMGNKGATAIRLTFTPSIELDDKAEVSSPISPDQQSREDTPPAGPVALTFVNAHLAAFDEMVDRRNQEFHDLSKRLAFGKDLDGIEVSNEYYEPETASPTNVSIYESDALFWMGDLNYRVDIPDPEFRKMLADKDWEDRLQVLLRRDQLKVAMTSQKAFDGFTEHPIEHLPTYRFSPGLGMDELGYDQKRRPAWTDRVLYIPGPFCEVTQHSYTSYPQITMSDHRPVAAEFTVDFDLYHKSQYDSVVRQMYRDIHALDMSHERPKLKIDQDFLDFGEIRYHTRSAKKIMIKNIGKVPCAWRLVPVQSDLPIHPEWLSIEPMTGMILPDEGTEITLTAEVDNHIASSLNLGPRDISGTLILHIVLGKDHFISISGEYLPSCFGNKLATLTRLPGPIRSLSSAKDLRPENHPLNAPREIMRLVNHLMGNHTPPKDLFLLPPDEAMIDTIRECLDTGEEFPWSPGEGGPEAEPPHAFAGALVRLLDSLNEPIIPPMLHPRCVQMTSRDEAFELLDALQPAAVNVWITITAFLHFICQSSGDPSYAEQIARIFVPALMRDDHSTTIPVSPIGKRKFFLHFIT